VWHDPRVIDKSGKWWTGETFEDLAEYLALLVEDEYPVHTVLEPQCLCGGRVFKIHRDATEGVARRTCIACGTNAFICDSGEHWSEARPRLVKCPCGESAYQVAVGFSKRDSGEIKWILVGERCVACGILGASVDWKIDYSPTDHLYAAI
jgi:hypothetical protein